jgi:hypothetical protein
MFTGNESHDISLQDAANLTANYRDQFASGTNYIKGEFFGKSAIQTLLNQDECVGLRIYYGLDDQKVQKLVIVGVLANEEDMIDGNILEIGSPCPPICGSSNILNS